MRISLFVFVLSLTLLAKGQESEIINLRQRRVAYLGIINPIATFVEQSSCNSIELLTDNGKIEKEGCSYNYFPANLGEVTFTIRRKVNGKIVGVNKIKWLVEPLPKPMTSIGGVSSGSRMTKSQFLAQGGVAAYVAPWLGFELSYNVDSFSFIIMQDSTVLFSSRISGAAFTLQIKKAVERMETGFLILIANIYVRLPDGSITKADPIEYPIN